jgi:hypothetical protein
LGEDQDWLARIARESGQYSRSPVVIGAVLLVGGISEVPRLIARGYAYQQVG